MRTVLQLGLNGFGVLGRRPETNLHDVLELVRRGGFDGIEVMSNLVGDPGHRRVLRRQGPQISAVHLFVEEMEERGLDEWIHALEELGWPALALSSSTVRGTSESVARLADRIGVIADRVRSMGSMVYYHAHGTEYGILPGTDESGIDFLLRSMPGLRLILDTYWMFVAGFAPADLITRYARNSGYYHLKDGTADGGGAEFGEGVVPLRESVRAGAELPLDWVALEQDEATADPERLFARFHELVALAD